jgi:hypothetical protein
MNKIDKRKNYYLVLDVETANTLEQPLCYDVGFAICDKSGKIYTQRSYIVPEIFFDEKEVFGNGEMMNTAYYAEKLPQYYKGIRTGTWKIKPLYGIRSEILSLMKEYNVKAVAAYNASFDVNALNQTIRYVSKSKNRWFFPYGTEVICIWHMACQTIFLQKQFDKIAVANQWESEKGNVHTNAEIAWRYIKNAFDFEEAHTGLEDVKIECQIMAKCFAQHQKMVKTPNRLCWRIPQKQYKNFKKEISKTA